MRILQKTCTSAATVAMLSAALSVSPAAAQVYNNTSAASTISAGVSIPVRTSDVINASTEDGRIFTGVVDQDVFDDNGRLAIPRGSTAELMVKRDSGDLAVDLESLTINGQRYAVDVDPAKTVGTSGSLGDTIQNGAGTIGANKDTATYIGGGALLGTIIGAIAGGGKGAAIGAILGGGAGTGARVYEKEQEAEVKSGTSFGVILNRAVSLPEYRAQ
jgi:hypothetical protein